MRALLATSRYESNLWLISSESGGFLWCCLCEHSPPLPRVLACVGGVSLHDFAHADRRFPDDFHFAGAADDARSAGHAGTAGPAGSFNERLDERLDVHEDIRDLDPRACAGPHCRPTSVSIDPSTHSCESVFGSDVRFIILSICHLCFFPCVGLVK